MNIDAFYNEARSGNNQAEEELFQHLSVRFRLFAHQRIWNEDDVDDIVQSAMMAIAKEYRSLAIEKSFTAWAYKVLDNRILSYIKTKSSRRRRLEPMGEEEVSAGAVDPDPDLESMLLDCIRKVAASNRRYARILNLYYQGYTTEEVCRRLKMTANHSYVTLSRARSMLELCLDTGDIK
ncbi:MAG: sigma-70 family RNA polymerase sigma factor [FCB group bacterium]|nr:sigma-70 family RNA polymerase sigma factor [FCB group bacterium]